MMQTAIPSSDADQKKIVDSFVAMAYNRPELMRFLNIAVDTFERKGTMKLSLHIKSGEPKGGDGSFSF